MSRYGVLPYAFFLRPMPSAYVRLNALWRFAIRAFFSVIVKDFNQR